MALVLDCEVSPNYVLTMMMNPATGEVFRWERFNDVDLGDLTRSDMVQMLAGDMSVGFNSEGYDQWIIAAYLDEFSNDKIYRVSKHIIEVDMGRYNVGDHFDLEIPEWNHVDIMPIAPGMASLKSYAGRIHAPQIQDLPVDPHEPIDDRLRRKLLPYCENDLRCTWRLFRAVQDKYSLRKSLTSQYQIKLTSKSDPQIAEGVMRKLLRSEGVDVRPRQLQVQPYYRYTPPDYLRLHSEELRAALHRASTEQYKISEKGSVLLPDGMRQVVEFCGAKYKMGIGGLHSQEKKQCIWVGEHERLWELDVASMYPSMILTNGWNPSPIGEKFNQVYQQLVDQRLEAKRTGDKTLADSGKIIVNSIFGKFGSRFSTFYDPQLLIQTTVTGQLSLLMLIEQIERHTDARVVSANTDGVVVWSPNHLATAEVGKVARRWERATSLDLEETDYEGIVAQDCNNYFAFKADGSTKGKGLFAPPGLMKNPVFPIATQAAMNYLIDGTPPMETIRGCDDIRQFIATRKVKGGAIYRGQNIGKTVRWYTGYIGDQITYPSGYKVPLTESAEVVNKLPDFLPADIDLGWYLERAEWIVNQTGNKIEPQAKAA